MSDARDVVLARVRNAIAGAEAPTVQPRDFRRAGTLDRDALVELFCRRIGDYRADVRRIGAAGVKASVGEALATRGGHRIGVPSGLRADWRPDGPEVVEDAGLAPAELARLDGVLTGCTLAVAETGTIVLSSAPDEGRRALTLVPDLHVCIVRERQIVELLPEAIDVLADLVRHERRPLTFVSGPSATSDIELSRVEGVHGPRDLVVLVVSQEPT
jgi:L-lactate dehydrogenase complex protein LldG